MVPRAHRSSAAPRKSQLSTNSLPRNRSETLDFASAPHSAGQTCCQAPKVLLLPSAIQSCSTLAYAADCVLSAKEKVPNPLGNCSKFRFVGKRIRIWFTKLITGLNLPLIFAALLAAAPAWSTAIRPDSDMQSSPSLLSNLVPTAADFLEATTASNTGSDVKFVTSATPFDTIVVGSTLRMFLEILIPMEADFGHAAISGTIREFLKKAPIRSNAPANPETPKPQLSYPQSSPKTSATC